jgi:hypothetical protein
VVELERDLLITEVADLRALIADIIEDFQGMLPTPPAPPRSGARGGWGGPGGRSSTSAVARSCPATRCPRLARGG